MIDNVDSSGIVQLFIYLFFGGPITHNANVFAPIATYVQLSYRTL